MSVAFRVYGIPKPGGSKKAFVRGGRAHIVEDSKNKDWRADVKGAALAAFHNAKRKPFDVQVLLEAIFVMPRPGSHYRTGKRAGELKANAPHWHTKTPDATKLLRSTEDALTGVAWIDDKLIAEQRVVKIYQGNKLDPTGAAIRIRPLHPVVHVQHWALDLIASL